MVLYIPVTKKGKLDNGRVALSEKKYNEMINAQKNKYSQRFAMLAADMQDIYDYLVIAGISAVTKDSATSKRGAVYTVWFPYSVAYGRSNITVTASNPVEAINYVMDDIKSRISQQNTAMQVIMHDVEEGYVKVVTEEDELELNTVNTDPESKFESYRNPRPLEIINTGNTEIKTEQH